MIPRGSFYRWAKSLYPFEGNFSVRRSLASRQQQSARASERPTNDEAKARASERTNERSNGEKERKPQIEIERRPSSGCGDAGSEQFRRPRRRQRHRRRRRRRSRRVNFGMGKSSDLDSICGISSGCGSLGRCQVGARRRGRRLPITSAMQMPGPKVEPARLAPRCRRRRLFRGCSAGQSSSFWLRLVAGKTTTTTTKTRADFTKEA